MSDRDPEYEHIDNGIGWRFETDVGPILFYATDIRRESSEKAYIKIGVPGERAVAMSTCALKEDMGYNALANRAALSLWGVRHSDERAIALRERMMLFCDGLFQFWLGERSGEDVAGDTAPSAPPWSIPGLVLANSPVIWAGEAGSNKSTLMRLCAQSIRYAVPEVIPIRREGMSVWVNAEESPEEHSRQLGNTNEALGLDRDAEMFTLDARSLTITDLVPRLQKAVEYTRADHIFIDSLSRLARGMDLNQNATATLLIDSVAALGASVTWLGHTGHENPDRLAGSKHFQNAARLMCLISSRATSDDHLTRGVRARVYKANGAVPTEALYWTLRYHEQHGLVQAALSTPEEWPLLYCEAASGNSECGRRTWDGVMRSGKVLCSRHRDDEQEG